MESEISQGRGDSTIDAATEKDRALIRDQMRKRPKRWTGITPEIKQRVINALDWALDEAQTAQVPDDPLAGPKVIASVGKTLALIEAQNQRDEHQEADDKPREVIHRHYVIPPPRLLNGES